ncbi:MAG: PKD domain-containing protein, partial [Candidatus Hydrothermarchaeota archaeon]
MVNVSSNFTAYANIGNIGNATATNVTATLIVPPNITSFTPLTQSFGNLSNVWPANVISWNWTLHPSAPGNYTLLINVTAANAPPATNSTSISAVSPAPPPNVLPVANAGPDQTVNDTDDSGFENVTLNGSLSFDPDGVIINFTWLTNGDLNAPTIIGRGEVINANFSVGVHNVTLNVTDDDGASDTDSVLVTVNAPALNTPPGVNVTVTNQTAGVNLTFSNVTEGGQTSVNVSSTGPSPPGGFNLSGNYYEFT